MHPLDRVNGALLLAAAALGALLWLAPDRSAEWPPLTGAAPEGVRAISLYADGQLAWRLSLGPDGWLLSHPQSAPAAAERVASLTRLLRTPSLDRFPAPAAGLEPYGLARPPYRLVFDALALEFGRTEPTTGHRYVLVDGRVHLIGDGYYHYLAGGADQWRARDD